MKEVIYINKNNGVFSFISENEVSSLREKGVKVIATHNSEFHADELVAVTIAIIIFGEVIVYRIPDVTDNIVNNFDFIVDVSKQYDGIKFFDHHQELPLYADGVKPCGATLFAEAIWENKEEYKEIIYPYILRPIAVVDNGQHELFSTYPNHLFGWVETLNPVWNDNSQSGDSQFLIALQMALTIFQQEIAQLRSAKDAIEVLANAKRVENGKIIILPQSVPTWKEEYSKDENALFVMFPSLRGGYFVQCVPPSMEEEYCQKVPLPKEWKINKPDGLIFVHKDLFCCSFETPEQAIKALLPLC